MLRNILCFFILINTVCKEPKQPYLSQKDFIMEQRLRDAVYGYVRQNYEADNMIDDIVNIIYQYYLIRLASKILNVEEQSSFIDFLFDELKQQKENKNMNLINAKLLYRASDHEYLGSKFHELCHDKGATITIIHNEYDHIFGVYLSKSI